MEIEIKHQPAFALAVAQLSANEQIKVEPGSMVSFSDGVTVETKVEGGLFGGLKRMVTGESFFQNTYLAPAQGGEITLAPSYPGDIVQINVESGKEMLLASGAYMACEMGLTMDSKWGGAKGFFGAGTLLLIRVSGKGKLLVSAYGALEERVLAAGQKYIVDTGHIVAFDAGIEFRVRGMGNMKATFLSGEGLVCELTGPGRVLMQTRSASSLVSWLSPLLPTKSS